MFQLYKYQDGDEILYIGQTIRPVYRRIAEHYAEDPFQTTHAKVYIAFVRSQAELDIFERLLIAKYQPPLNTMWRAVDINIEFKEPEWLLYEFPETEEARIEAVTKYDGLCRTCINPKCKRCDPSAIALYNRLLRQKRR